MTLNAALAEQQLRAALNGLEPQEPADYEAAGAAPSGEVAIPYQILWGPWGGKHLVLALYRGKHRVPMVDVISKHEVKDEAMTAALDQVRLYPQAGIQFARGRELAIYLQ